MKETIQQASKLLARGNAIAAESNLRLKLSNGVKNEEAQALLGHSLMMQNKTNEALAVFQEVVTQHPNSASALSELASTLLSMGKKIEAEQAFKKAVALNPHYSDVWHYLGNLLMLRGETDEAMGYFKKAEQTDPFRDYFLKINQFLKQKNNYGAEKVARTVILQHPNHPQALYTLAKLAERAKAYEQVVKILELSLIHI